MKRRIADLIDIPERVQKGDFVLGLTEGVKDPRATLKDYVVTDQLRGCFDDALSFIRSAIETGSSKAALLHGSFGSGKSHFMAVLHLLLGHNPEVRAIERLAPVIARHAPWLDGRKLLLVPTHMIDAVNLESRLLDAYVQTVRALHPEAPLPAVYLADRIFENAREMRQHQGDEAFFRMLNRQPAGEAKLRWGKVAGWDGARFEEALRAPPGSDLRHLLVSALVANVLTAYRDMAASRGEGFVTLDEGLSVISRHAKELGYQGVVLFLDELILWLASHVADLGFINREGAKLSKLVESATADRPVPIVSFVAEQRDLRDLVGTHVPGAEQLGFVDGFKHWRDRFHRIHLEDRNLPDIVAHRLLRPRSPAAAAELQQGFGEILRLREEVLSALLTSEADRTMFERVYPFSPALLQAMIGVSSALQRTRTAIRLLLQLLVARREDLLLGEVVPVGDLWDVIAEGDEPFMDAMRINFERARRLYRQKLRPLIETQHGVRAEELASLPADDPRRAAFRADDRLIKTLLLAALVPEVEALKGLTASRLAALNQGSVVSNIPGREGRLVLERVRSWSAQVGEPQISDDRDPTIHIQLTGVDTDSILARARIQDNLGPRRLLVRRLLFAMLGIVDEDALILEHTFLWRGTRRRVEIIYGNVREMPEDSLRGRGEDWRVVIDYPFDEEGHGPQDDRAKLEAVRRRGEPARTFVWLPRFFTRQTLSDLGTLVVLDYLLTGERFGDHAAHLSAVDRAAARALLENQKSQLEQRMKQALLEAYGVTGSPDRPLQVEGSHRLDETFECLEPGLTVVPPVAATLGEAFQKILTQLLDWQYPAHPEFGEEVKAAQLKKVWEEVRRATQARDGRIVVPRELRPLLRQIAGPLKLGEMTEGDAFLLGQHWRLHFERKIAQEPGPEAGPGPSTKAGEVTVRRLRQWMDEPRKMGLPRELQNLAVLTFTWQTNRAFYLHGGPREGRIDQLPDELELREQVLPEPADWDEARRRAEALFGLMNVSELCSAADVSDFVTRVREKVAAVREGSNHLVDRLSAWYEVLGLLPGAGSDEAATGRLATARTALRLVEALAAGEVNDAVRTLARARLAPSAQAVGTSLRQAARLAGALSDSRLQVIAGALQLEDARREEAEALGAAVRAALGHDELAQPLEEELMKAERKAVQLLAQTPGSSTGSTLSTQPEDGEGGRRTPRPRARLVAKETREDLKGEAIREVLRQIESAAMQPGRRLTIEWTIEETGPGSGDGGGEVGG